MACKMEAKILDLLSPRIDSSTQEFDMLDEVLKNPDIHSVLYECMNTTKIPLVEQSCVCLIKKSISKEGDWKRVPEKVKKGLKTTVLDSFSSEVKRLPKGTFNIYQQYLLSAIAELIATIAKHELAKDEWPELMTFINSYIHSKNAQEKVIGLYAMSIVTNSAAKYFKKQTQELLGHFSKILEDTSSPKAQFFSIVCISNLIYFSGQEQIHLLQNLVPLILKVIRNLVISDKAEVFKAMGIFDSLMWSKFLNVPVIDPHIELLITFWLELASNQKLDEEARIKALRLVRWLIRLKKENIVELNLISPILAVLFPIMCQSGDDVHDLHKEDDDDLSLSSTASQVIGTMALRLPSESLMTPLMRHVETALKSKNPQHRIAAYMSLAVITKNCSKHIKDKGLEKFVKMIRRGIKETDPATKNAAVYCLGQFTEYLQPDIHKHVSDLLPVLLDYLQTICQRLKDEDRDPPNLSKTFDTLELFCKNLDDKFLPNLSLVIDNLLSFLDTKSHHAKELSISIIGFIACSGKGNFAEYFLKVLNRFKDFVCDTSLEETKENIALKVHAVDTVCTVANIVKINVFSKFMAQECVNLGMTLIAQVDDPTLRRSVYELFSAMTYILKNDIDLSSATGHILNSITSTKGIKVPFLSQEPRRESLQSNLELLQGGGQPNVNATKKSPSMNLFEDVDFDDEDPKSDVGKILYEEDDDENARYDEDDDYDDDFDDITQFPVDNPYLIEKDAAFCALQDLAANSGRAFLPYLDRCFNEIQKLLNHPIVVVRTEVVGTLGHFCIALNDACIASKKNRRPDLEWKVDLSDLEKKLDILLPILFKMVKEDKERHVVSMCLKTLRKMLDNIKDIITKKALRNIVSLISDVFQHKLVCQGVNQRKLKYPESEYSRLIFEFAAVIILSILKSIPWEQFDQYFANLLPHLLLKIKRTRSSLLKSSLIGILGEIIYKMKFGAARPYVMDLLPIFGDNVYDINDEIRSNAVYGLGTLIQNVGETLFDNYPDFMKNLMNLLIKEDSAPTLDNVCSTVSKMIIINTPAIPLKEVLPLMFNRLPLKVDMNENIVIYKCFDHLYNIQSEEFLARIDKVLKILCEALTTQKLNEETKTIVIKLLRSIRRHFSSDFNTFCTTIPKEQKDKILTALAV